MQASRRLFNKAATTPKWHSTFHKSEVWQTPCACTNKGILWVTDSIFCLTQRWAGAGAEFKQVFSRVKNFDITLGDVWKSSAFGVQCFLIFHLGNVVSRGSFQGYIQGPPMYETFPDPNAKSHH